MVIIHYGCETHGCPQALNEDPRIQAMTVIGLLSVMLYML